MMRSIRWSSILGSFLISAIFFAPDHSAAGVPKVTVSWGLFGSSPSIVTKSVPVSSTNACSTNEKSTGYTHCYKITAGTYTFSNGESFTIADFDSTRVAKVLMVDTSSSINVDLLTMSGIKITPPPQIASTTCTDPTNPNLCKRLQIQIEAKFDVANPASSTTKVGVRVGGNQSSNTAVSPFNQKNFIIVKGEGLFTTSTTKTTFETRTYTEGSNTNPVTNLPSTLSTSTPPTVNCNNAGLCTPTLYTTIIHTPQIGKDILQLPNSSDQAFSMASCDPCIAPPEQIAEKNLQLVFGKLKALDDAVNLETGSQPGEPCSEPDCDKDKAPTTSITIRKTIACGGHCSANGLSGPSLLRFTFKVFSEPYSSLIGTVQIEMAGGTGTVSQPYVETREVTLPVVDGSYHIEEVASVFWSKDFPTCTNGNPAQGKGITGTFTASATCDFQNTANLP